MSMHLLPSYWTTCANTTKRRKQKRSNKQLAADAAHKKFLKKHGFDPDRKKSKSQPSVGKSGNPPALGAGNRKFESCHSDQFYNETSSKQKPNTYTGKRKLLGIATMHKSNMVPVFSEEDAEQISKMRR